MPQKAKLVLETESITEHYEPKLFIFKNEVAIMLDETEIEELKELIKDI